MATATSPSNHATELLEHLMNFLEEMNEGDFEVEFDGTSLTIEIGKAQFLLNFHKPTEQLWLSSPLSGAHHFKWEERGWVSTRGTLTLIDLLEKELSTLADRDILLHHA